MTADDSLYARGLTLSALGMLLISPDALLLRLVKDEDQWGILFHRSFFVLIALGTVVLVRYGRRLPRFWTTRPRLQIAVTLFSSLNLTLFITAISLTSVANTLVLLATMPFWSAVIGRVAIGEKVAPRSWAAMALGFVGVIVIFAGGLGGGTLAGDLAALGAGISHGFTLVILRVLGNNDVMPYLAGGSLVTTLFASTLTDPFTLTRHDGTVLAFMGLVHIPISISLFFSGARFTPAAEVALLSLLETSLGPLWVWLGVGEAPAPRTLAGGALIVIAVAMNALWGLAQRRRRRRREGLGRGAEPPV